MEKNELQFPLLTADDIECRVGNVNGEGKGFSLLLYKTARTDIKYLNQVVGVLNWKRRYEMVGDTMFCIVSIKDKDTGEWVEKEDCGSESNIEKEKGLASDCFKRACFSLGLGIELYTAPFIWVSSTPQTISKDKYKKYSVKHIAYTQNREISELEIVNENGELVYTFGTKNKVKKDTTKVDTTNDELPISAEQLEKLDNYFNSLSAERQDKFLSFIKQTYHLKTYRDLTIATAREVITRCKIG